MRFLRVFVLILLIPSASLADPILLADSHPPFGTQHTTCNGCAEPTQSSFDIHWFGSPGSSVFLFGNTDPDGFGFQIGIGTTGTFDFSAANAPGFDALVARLTDSSNDRLVFIGMADIAACLWCAMKSLCRNRHLELKYFASEPK